MRRFLVVTASAVLPALLVSCYSIRASAPPNSMTTLASTGEVCTPVHTRRVHYALVGLVPLNNNEVTVPANARARVITEADGVDILLRAIGAVFTLGLYGGTQSATLELCQTSGYVAGAPTPYPQMPPPAPVYNAPAPYAPMAPPPPSYPAPPPSHFVPTVEIPVVIGSAGGVAGAGAPRRPARDSNQAICSSGLDCGSGEFCHDRGDNVKVCMGDGVRGDFCRSGIDCGSGMFCKMTGDGFKRCQ
ncbi:MAG: hypothetical protein AB7O24_18400 [Kofleriaceae bacterium]